MKRILYTVWFGPKMSDVRKQCFDSILKNTNVEVVLINEDNFKDYLKNYHPRFDTLSREQFKADYIRAYMMYHYGGGYSDIKMIDYDWNSYFDELDKSDKDAIGYQELPGGVSFFLPKHIRNKHQMFIGCGHFIFKKGSPLAKQYLNTIHQILDQGDPKRGELSGVFHKAQLRHLNSTIKNMPIVNGKSSGIPYR